METTKSDLDTKKLKGDLLMSGKSLSKVSVVLAPEPLKNKASLFLGSLRNARKTLGC